MPTDRRDWLRQLLRRKPTRHVVASGICSAAVTAWIANRAGMPLTASSGAFIFAALLFSGITHLFHEVRGSGRDNAFGHNVNNASDRQLLLSCVREAVVTRQLNSDDLAHVLTKALEVISTDDAPPKDWPPPLRRRHPSRRDSPSPRRRRSKRPCRSPQE
ncbi:hypothetical protein [Nocardia aurantiaca]|uniref:Uncharacterized protein n=1 Tax=Nocardia aurantiaca TaxID=2675850 RepID=A0A6I3L8T1_9NOCA|nr:hypothetical protein [Nocardia aurantiaca]MTE16269.1 hypothetical protein [Nocardia aurantiaca]